MQKRKIKSKNQSQTGTYVFDADQGKVVKISSHIPKVASTHKSEDSGAQTGPCGKTECGGGACASTGEDWN
ncbi:MAG: hypothetical protein A3G41_06565 [Elusimicrobia bacterium RIFCSPLOWO2_12_FULL_59_9]|nr:MAG: hypothetical protein A3G41_06565 [Elusimicrobia bacterium RIFCSPLOWO2_12_FULL_59_9]